LRMRICEQFFFMNHHFFSFQVSKKAQFISFKIWIYYIPPSIANVKETPNSSFLFIPTSIFSQSAEKFFLINILWIQRFLQI
jgi:hypothetical protein